MGEDGGGHKRGILNADPMVYLVALLEPAKDGDRILDARFLHHDRLEAALERGILLDVFTILIERGGSDRAKFSTRQLWFQEIGGIHRSLGGTGTDDGVKLVNEENDLPLGGGNLLQKSLQSILKLTPELRSCHHRADIHRDETLVLERLGNIPAHDTAGQSLDDGSLADTGFTNKNRVVFGAAGEDLHGAPDLLVATDDGIYLPLAGKFGDVSTVFLQSLVFPLGILVGDALASADLDKGFHEPLMGHAMGVKQFCGSVLLLTQRKKVMLGGEKLILELCHLALGRVDGLAQFVAHKGLGTSVHLGKGCSARFELCDEGLNGHPHLL